MLTREAFNALATQGFNRIPVILELFADLDTPLSIYLKLANQPYSYLLESVEGGERFGRYSFIGLPAKTRLSVNANKTQVFQDNHCIEVHEGNPLLFITAFQARFRVPDLPDLPRFVGGLVGYFGFDTIAYIEKRLAQSTKPDTLGIPDIELLLSEELAVVDNLSGKLYLICYGNPLEIAAYDKAVSRLQILRQALRTPCRIPFSEAMQPPLPCISEMGEQAFKEAIIKAKQYIHNGDIMQVVLSQRMHIPFTASPLAFYRALRSVNPSPYMFFYHFGDFHIVGASPEILTRLEKNTVTVRPIAGTRPRGKTREADLILAEELLADPKEMAEHIMLMDLGRNDAGRVCEIGSVHVTDQMLIERYSHVMHIVSCVEGQLKEGLSHIDVLRATFPAGTVSGAPKVRALEIIDELEPSKRGIYAGAVGYLGFNGDMDMAIALRTALIKDQTLFVQAGAGIVADSVPEAEWIETQNKARAILHAAELAQRGLDA
jgi:anthranilate synthase component 1